MILPFVVYTYLWRKIAEYVSPPPMLKAHNQHY